MRSKARLVYGVGINDLEESIKINGKFIPVYSTWKSMLQRCYYLGTLQKNPTYQGCEVAPDWHRLSNFKIWFDLNYMPGFHLDKDILVQGNKLYSSETCSFVPNYINYLIVGCDSDDYTGVSPRHTIRKDGSVTTTYQAYCNNGKGKSLRASFKTLNEAVLWYANTKQKIVSDVASEALRLGYITVKIYNALISRKFG